MRPNIIFVLFLAILTGTAQAELVRRGNELSTYANRPQMRDFLAEVRRDSFIKDSLMKSELEKFNFDRFGREYGRYGNDLFRTGTGSVVIPELGTSPAKPATVATELLAKMTSGDLTNVRDFNELFGVGTNSGKATKDVSTLVVNGNAAIFSELPSVGPKGEAVKKPTKAAIEPFVKASIDTLTPGSNAFNTMLANAKARGEVDKDGKPTSAQYALAAQLAVGEYMQLLGEHADFLAKQGLDVQEMARGILGILVKGGVSEVTFHANTLLANLKVMRTAEGKNPPPKSLGGDHTSLVSTAGGSGGKVSPAESANALRVAKGSQHYGNMVRTSTDEIQVRDKLAEQLVKNAGGMDLVKANPAKAGEIAKTVANFCQRCAKSCDGRKGGAGAFSTVGSKTIAALLAIAGLTMLEADPDPKG